jgi:hypothetical protein
LLKELFLQNDQFLNPLDRPHAGLLADLCHTGGYAEGDCAEAGGGLRGDELGHQHGRLRGQSAMFSQISLVFRSCESLASVSFNFDSQLRRIEDEAFREMSVRNFVVPKSVETIGVHCFRYCLSPQSALFEALPQVSQ